MGRRMKKITKESSAMKIIKRITGEPSAKEFRLIDQTLKHHGTGSRAMALLREEEPQLVKLAEGIIKEHKANPQPFKKALAEYGAKRLLLKEGRIKKMGTSIVVETDTPKGKKTVWLRKDLRNKKWQTVF